MTAEQKINAELSRPVIKFSQRWCSCREDTLATGDFRYFEDNECSCGIEKHHYHCEFCGGLLQVG